MMAKTEAKIFFGFLTVRGFQQPKSGFNSCESNWLFDHTGGYRSQRRTKRNRTAEQERKIDEP